MYYILNIEDVEMIGHGNYLLSTAYQNFVRTGVLPEIDDILDRIISLEKYRENNAQYESKVEFAKIEIEGCRTLLDIHNKSKIYED